MNHCRPVPCLGSKGEPATGLGGISRKPLPGKIRAGQIGLSLDVALLCSLGKPLRSGDSILFHPYTTREKNPKLTLCIGQPTLGFLG